MHAAAQRGRILLVDDQEALIEVVDGMLTAAGYTVRSTLDATKAIAVAREFRPHVALLGIVMPVIGGVELGMDFATLFPNTKIVFWSEVWADGEGAVTPQMPEGWRKQGYRFDILPSPIEKEELLGKMKMWVAESTGEL